MKKRTLLGLLLLAAPLAALSPSDIVLVHLADGLQWTTTFTVVNLDTAPASFTLYFYANDGTPLPMGIEGVTTGTITQYQGNLGVNGSAVIQTTGGPVLKKGGWARITSIQKLGAQAVFVERKVLSDGTTADYQAAVPAGQFSSAFRLAFDNTNQNFTGVAIVNNDQVNSVTVNATFRDQTGAVIGVPGQVAVIKPYGHTAILLNHSFPITTGRIGSVDFTCPSFCQISGLGLQFTPNNGPFTSSSAYGL
jgi:hypothetical protein